MGVLAIGPGSLIDLGIFLGFFRVVNLRNWLNILGFFFITLVCNMFLILYIQLPSLQVDMIDVKVVVIELHMDHFLTFLVHFILF